MSGLRQYCTFHAGGLYLGLDVRAVQEVIRHRELTGVPTASSVVRGLINLRGQIVTAIDLRRRLGLPALADDATPFNVILRSKDGAVSLLVDEIDDVREVDLATINAPPETLRREVRSLVIGLFQLSDRLLLVLDADRVTDFDAAA
jgi:purine-binding chemotaxis protein CheW